MTVTDVNGEAPGVGDDFIGQDAVQRIDVAVHRFDRCDAAERIENLPPSDVAGVENS